MKTQARTILILLSLCLSGGLLAMNSTPQPLIERGTPSPMQLTFANVNTVLAQVESVNWASL